MKAPVVLLVLLGMASTPLRADDRTYLQAAQQAAKWIRASAIQTDKGTIWPADPRDPKSVSLNLYSGTPGVVLFFMEAYRSTGDESYLKDARSGADYLLHALPEQNSPGLYTGIAGIGFTLQETFKATKDNRYREGALRCARWLQEHAAAVGKGMQWNETTDIIAGGAGVGLFLLYAARELKEPAFRDLAARAAGRLIEVGRPEAGGLKWAMDAKFPRLMPNFSHGTAGIAYFLTTVYAETGKKEFLAAALAGAKYLQAVAQTEGDVCLIFHHEPDGKDLYYLGWCHGPVGTARLFYQLYKATGDHAWMEWVKKSARAVMQSGIPEKQTPGFWNNVSQCCGSAGVAEFFLDLYKVTRERDYLVFAERVTANLLSRASSDGSGMRWIQAEHRVKPDLLLAQTGYMQGAAGIGMLLLHLDNFKKNRPSAIKLPDSPF
ncbi:MAG TPA: lanthionine synthetase LanC family protein [Blastocatellia bacterium]|nr:lanthionine synthetase LanC family protein [Blastocatellia bacterium]